ncbi:protransforming growth factor alpha-like [Oncorhynchus masou masou]|uniref:protransforming growth factor alpha-like n=1 Tax=Oncorhynchus masou masou TaxID=90313 RepID=UPI00318314BA
MMNRAFWDVIFLITGSLFTYGTGQDNSTIATNSTMTTTPPVTTTTVNTTLFSTTTSTITTTNLPVKKFVAAAVRSHFDDCPDSHSHFCFHGTCRFLILEETPACVCHQGFVGMRCEHADLLAVVATNHRQQTVATALVLCVIGCVLTMLLFAGGGGTVWGGGTDFTVPQRNKTVG